MHQRVIFLFLFFFTEVLGSFLFKFPMLTGKHDGSVQGVSYYSCKPKHGIFVKADKLILDKRGRALHSSKSEVPSSNNLMRRSQSRAEGMSDGARKMISSGTYHF